MIYQRTVAFNELSANAINDDNKESVLKSFFNLCLTMIELSGKSRNNHEKFNFQRLLFDENFTWETYLGVPLQQYLYLIDDKWKKDRIRTLLATFDLPSIPEYRFEKPECKGLGYANEQKILSKSLETDEKWKKINLQIDKIENDEELTTSQANVTNIANLDNAFEILEQFADKFYENCYSEKMYFEANINPKDNKTENFTHNLLPLKDISNLYLTHKKLYDENGKVQNVTETKKITEIVAAINGWKVCNPKGRVVYKHHNTIYYLSNDTKKGDFEIHNSQGKHIGAISLDCKKQEGLVENRKITPC
jgi:hypothetical protein